MSNAKYTHKCFWCKCSFITTDLSQWKCDYCLENKQTINTQQLKRGDMVYVPNDIHGWRGAINHCREAVIDSIEINRCKVYYKQGCYYEYFKYENVKKDFKIISRKGLTKLNSLLD